MALFQSLHCMMKYFELVSKLPSWLAEVMEEINRIKLSMMRCCV
mgnify:CR=1 FL=1